MVAEVWDDREACDHATAICQACGQIVWVWVRFAGYGKGWQVCPECLRDASRALDEHFAERPEGENDEPPKSTETRTPTLAETLEGAERAAERVAKWPRWKRELQPGRKVNKRRRPPTKGENDGTT